MQSFAELYCISQVCHSFHGEESAYDASTIRGTVLGVLAYVVSGPLVALAHRVAVAEPRRANA